MKANIAHSYLHIGEAQYVRGTVVPREMKSLEV